MTRQHALKLRELIVRASASLTDDDALTGIELFNEWQTDTSYQLDDRIRYNEKLYKVVQAHTSQSGWTPDITPALFTVVAPSGTIPVWKQPTGAQDAYMTGDKVHYPDKDGMIYMSTMDYNVYEPTVYGWEAQL